MGEEWISLHVMCQWWPGYASWTVVLGMPESLFEESRFWTSSSDVPSGAKGTKKCPVRRPEKAGGPLYDATAMSGRW
jgi:hypothetical protein